MKGLGINGIQQIWLLRMKASRGQSQLREDERRYEKLLLEDIPDDISEQIQKDLSRTYPQCDSSHPFTYLVLSHPL